MDQQTKLEELMAQADVAAQQLEEMGTMMGAFAGMELAVSFEDLASQITPVSGGFLGGPFAALRG